MPVDGAQLDAKHLERDEEQQETDDERDRLTQPFGHLLPQRAAFWLIQAMASSSRRSNSVEVVTEPVVGGLDDPQLLRLLAASASILCTSASGTNSSWVEWIAPSGVGLTRSIIAAVLKLGSLGTPCVT